MSRWQASVSGLALIGCAGALALPVFLAIPEAEGDAASPRESRPALRATPPDGARLAELLLLADAPQSMADATAAFAGRERAATPAQGPFPALYPPHDFRASPQEGGIRLSWTPHPANPVEGIRYRITRWAGAGEAEFLVDTGALEHLDPVDCEGISYRYRIAAALERQVPSPGGESRRVLRESPRAAASAARERTARWSAVSLDENQRIGLILERQGRGRLGPFPAGPGEAVGSTGWFLEELTLRETPHQAPSIIPRFDGLGRRVIIDGRPANRTRLVTVQRVLAKLRFTDPCGASLSLELLLPEGVRLAEDG